MSTPYDLTNWKTPVVPAPLLPFLAALAEGPLGGLVARTFLRDVGVDAWRTTPVEAATPAIHPIFEGSERGDEAEFERACVSPTPPDPHGRFESAGDFHRAYVTGRTTPSEVAERVLAWSKDLDGRPVPMRVLIAQSADDVRAQAAAATARYKAGASLGPLDGVPVTIKDELDVRGYGTTVGTSFLGKTPATTDAFVVARLRAAGALLVGKANMHEIGIGVSGINIHHGACRNPYNPEHMTGGSSSGSAAAVAAGLSPIAMGADGGGSVRIPAAFCGVFGLKATFGRVSEAGAAPLCWSLGHVGPLAATAADLALAYAFTAGRDPADPNTFLAPGVTLDGETTVPAGLRIGVFDPWFADASTDIITACQAALRVLEQGGATRTSVTLPHLAAARFAHLVTIVGEMAASHATYLREETRRYSPEVRLTLALTSHFRHTDYINAQRHRAETYARFAVALKTADVIAVPTTARTAPRIPESALEFGYSDTTVTDQIMRNCAVSNLTGLPAVSVPVGYDRDGLPVGLQLIGRPYSEALLLRLAAAIEPGCERRTPAVHRRLLGI